MSNTEKKQWLKLLAFVKKRTKIILLQTHSNKKKSCYGYYGVDQNAILMVYNPKRKEFTLKSSILIHEFGHFIAVSQGLKYENKLQEEKEAWKIGMNSVPESLIPKDFFKNKERSLRTYRKYEYVK